MITKIFKKTSLMVFIIASLNQMANAEEIGASSNIASEQSVEQKSNGLNLGYSDPMSKYKAGQDYFIVKPVVPVSNKDTVEVINFFSYGCKPCTESSSMLDKWKADMPYYARVINSPISPNNASSYPARIYFSLQKLGRENLSNELMVASVSGKTDFSDFKILHSWLASRGVSIKDFDNAFDSNEVVSKVYAGPSIVKLYNIQAIPAIVVNGQYIIPPAVLKDSKQSVELLNYLVGISAKQNKIKSQ